MFNRSQCHLGSERRSRVARVADYNCVTCECGYISSIERIFVFAETIYVVDSSIKVTGLINFCIYSMRSGERQMQLVQLQRSLGKPPARSLRRTVGRPGRSARGVRRSPMAVGGRRSARSAVRRTVPAARLNEQSLARIAHAMPRPGCHERIRHQRPREPHQLHRRPWPQLSRSDLQRYGGVDRDVAMQVQKLLDRLPSTKTAGSCGSRKSSAASTATAKRFCGSLSIADGMTRIRFIEPDQVVTPPGLGERSLGQLRHSNRCGRCRERDRATTSTANSSKPTTCSTAARTSISTSNAACRCTRRSAKICGGPSGCCGT